MFAMTQMTLSGRQRSHRLALPRRSVKVDEPGGARI